MKQTKQIKLDWSRLTGFNQAKAIPGATSDQRTKSMIGLKNKIRDQAYGIAGRDAEAIGLKAFRAFPSHKGGS